MDGADLPPLISCQDYATTHKGGETQKNTEKLIACEHDNVRKRITRNIGGSNKHCGLHPLYKINHCRQHKTTFVFMDNLGHYNLNHILRPDI